MKLGLSVDCCIFKRESSNYLKPVRIYIKKNFVAIDSLTLNWAFKCRTNKKIAINSISYKIKHNLKTTVIDYK